MNPTKQGSSWRRVTRRKETRAWGRMRLRWVNPWILADLPIPLFYEPCGSSNPPVVVYIRSCVHQVMFTSGHSWILVQWKEEFVGSSSRWDLPSPQVAGKTKDKSQTKNSKRKRLRTRTHNSQYLLTLPFFSLSPRFWWSTCFSTSSTSSPSPGWQSGPQSTSTTSRTACPSRSRRSRWGAGWPCTSSPLSSPPSSSSARLDRLCRRGSSKLSNSWHVFGIHCQRYLTKENIIEVITLSTSTAYLVWVTMWDSSGWEEMIAG